MTTTREIAVPDIGDFESVDVIEVLIVPGDTIRAEDPLVTLESDKATMDVPAPFAGTISEIRVQAGDKVAQGSVLCMVEPANAPATRQTAEPVNNTPEADVSEQGATLQVADQVQPATQQSPQPPLSLPPPVERSGGALPHASPAVRGLARELGVDLSAVRGTGPKGRILKENVQQHVKAILKQPVETAPEAVASPGIPPPAQIDYSRWGPTETAPLSRIQKLSGPHLQRAWLNIPHVTHHDEADITDLDAFRRSLTSPTENSTVRVTVLTFLVKAVAAGLSRFPRFNAALSPKGESLIYRKFFNVGIAVDTEDGLVVPVIRAVDSKGIMQIASEMDDLANRARGGNLKPDDLQGGCISISNLGGIGGTAFTPIVNAPQVAILGAARSRMAPLWDGEEFRPRLVLPLSVSYDHRVIDGAEAARFTVFIRGLLEDTRRLVL
ncbi:MAG TPA: 2-oxo acid dehydrogenase subunit E2 [Arenicellales bacterium]|nr:2-oxo acid dehydrogenase subunit E2 [Arenicellales bacterium]HJP09050.1 2-oxo acid dehydrogenase subunit E2 [Arenicellales bacterium]